MRIKFVVLLHGHLSVETLNSEKMSTSWENARLFVEIELFVLKSFNEVYFSFFDGIASTLLTKAI